ncbi:hypothetical protein [Arthrobacter woluwensis]|uniref:hypothetical protein n=1 Tax=Arthrobacter woluwensis TaxID=156980 RepID=UPI001AAEBE4C|nr:hypothetical protein [Arthrobacter woluwensis]QTF73042.1 hypothetical protein G8758_14310 [Arthrobacter woluwensis]
MEYIAVILPSLVVGLLFWFAIRALLNADRSEREALAKAEEEWDAKAKNNNGESGASTNNSGAD